MTHFILSLSSIYLVKMYDSNRPFIENLLMVAVAVATLSFIWWLRSKPIINTTLWIVLIATLVVPLICWIIFNLFNY